LPTYAWPRSFAADFDSLSAEQQSAFAFLLAITRFLDDLRIGKGFQGLRVKGVKGASGIYEMTWAADGLEVRRAHVSVAMHNTTA
jgi:hypothetical protein